MKHSDFEELFQSAVEKNQTMIPQMSEDEWNRAFPDGFTPGNIMAFCIQKSSEYAEHLIHDVLSAAIVDED